MKVFATLLMLSGMVLAHSTGARAEDTSSNIEFALMPSAADVTLLNEGGKFVAVDLKKIAKGEKCHLDKDAIIAKVGASTTPGTTRVRYAAPNFRHGGCPFLTEFELSDTDYSAGRTAFTAKSDEAQKKIDALKKQLGDKWNELTQAAQPK